MAVHVRPEDAPRLALRGRNATRLLEGDRYGVDMTVRLVEVPPENPADPPRPPHVHDGAGEFIWVLEGHGMLHGAGGQFEVEAGEGVYVPAGERHKIAPRDGQPLELLCFFSTGDVASCTRE